MEITRFLEEIAAGLEVGTIAAHAAVTLATRPCRQVAKFYLRAPSTRETEARSTLSMRTIRNNGKLSSHLPIVVEDTHHEISSPRCVRGNVCKTGQKDAIGC